MNHPEPLSPTELPRIKILPAVKCLLPLSAGICLSEWVNIPFNLLFFPALALILLCVFIRRSNLTDWLLYPLLLLTGVTALNASSPSALPAITGVNITGRVLEPAHHYEDRVSFPLRLQQIESNVDGISGYGKVWVRVKQGSPKIVPGEILILRGDLQSISERRNPGDFDWKAYSVRNGFTGELLVATSRDLRKVTPASSTVTNAVLNGTLHHLRNDLIKRLDKLFHEAPDDAALMRALLTGIRRGIDPELTDDLRRTGLSHLLALSGLHVGFIIAMLLGISASLRLNLPRRRIAALLGALFFVLLLPPRASTVRAVVMAGVLLSGPIFKRWSHSLNNLAFAALVVLAFRPGDLFDAGFQLSFAAAFGILSFYPTIRRRWLHAESLRTRGGRLFANYIAAPFAVSAAATLFVMPLTAFHFGLLTPVAPLYNLVAIPLLWLIFASGWMAVLMSLVSMPVALLLAGGVQGFIYIWQSAVAFMAAIIPPVQYAAAPLLVIASLGLFGWLALSQRPFLIKSGITVAGVVTVILWQAALTPNTGLQVWFLDVGHGDATVVQMPGRRWMVIDGGPRSAYADRSALLASLRKLGARRLDVVMATHPEADHIGGLVDLLEAFPVRIALRNSSDAETQTFAEMMEVSKQQKVLWSLCNAGDSLSGLPDYISLVILSPPPSHPNWTTNDQSLVALLEYRPPGGSASRFLATGDIQKPAEAWLVAQGGIRAGLLKVPHHGSPTSSAPEFINAVQPTLAVISLAGWNERGRYLPTDQAVERLQQAGAQVYNTADEGAVLVKAGNDGIWRRIDWRRPRFDRWMVGTF